MSSPSRHEPEPLTISNEPGRILFGEERLLLLSAVSIGQLRQELHEVLGPIMAHEILFRFGFQDGVQAARAVRTRMPAGTPRDVLLVGPALHTQSGMAKVHVDSLDFDGEFRRLSGRWEASFEADQSLRLLGPVEWTACWVLSGFASGFASEATGRDLLCVERTCRARGDADCRFDVLPATQYPGLARKVVALREGRSLTERMKPAITRLWEQAYTSSAFLARILRDSADAIITLDENDVIRTWNRGAENLFLYSAREAEGRHFSFLVPPVLLTSGEVDHIRRTCMEQGSLRDYETTRLARDGREIRVSLTRTALFDVHGRYVGASAILRDISERQRLVDQLNQAERLAEVGRLAAQVAHEIKNPLAGISGAIQVLAQSTAPGDSRRAVFDEIQSHIRRLDRTVRSLLSYTRPYHPVRSPTDVGLLFESALSQVRSNTEFDGVRCEVDVEAGLPPARLDPQQMVQVLLNLLLNAAQALRADRRIFLRARRQGREVVIEVEDRGAGMTPETLAQIFQPFFTTRPRGTGLGLPIARRIVEAHGGRIEVRSGDGEGTTVALRVPAE